MKKELIIIVYKIAVKHLTRQQLEEQISQFIANYSLMKDELLLH